MSSKLVPNLNIDAHTEIEGTKSISHRKKEIIKFKKKSDNSLANDRRSSTKSNNSSLSNTSKLGSDGKQRKIIYKRKVLKKSAKTVEDNKDEIKEE